ncbi:MAG: hypothetical protein FGM24_08770 [Candidatus Kapabacteria bacterium]|nr:hypothetical protein [Candidatus Kapabacteria bacterium]
MLRIVILGLCLVAALVVGACQAARTIDRPRPIKIRCTTPSKQFIIMAADVLERNGYTVTVKDLEGARIEARDSVERIRYPYAALVREWVITHAHDTAEVHVRSINTRLDDSDVTQTWDKRRGDEIVKDWMRPVLTSLESACGLGTPVLPNRK